MGINRVFLDEAGFTGLSYLADAVVAVPDKAATILDQALSGITSPKLGESIRALRTALVQDNSASLNMQKLELIAAQLVRSSAPAAKNAGDALTWAISSRKSSRK